MSVADEVCAALKADGTFDGWRGVVKGRLQASRATDPVLRPGVGLASPATTCRGGCGRRFKRDHRGYPPGLTQVGRR